MIALFAAIMIINSLVVVTGRRRAEFARLRLAGATSEQIHRSVLAEASLVAGVGVALGLMASVATVVPYSIVRDEGIVPVGQLWLPALFAAVAVAITLAGASVAARRTLSSVDTSGPRAAVAT
jgi:putative ABC transport system permease protein